MVEFQSIHWNAFKELKEIKHPADVAIGDIVYLDNGNGFRCEEKSFDKAVVYGYCGGDFYAKIEETGRNVSFRFRGDMYKIVGKQLSSTQAALN